MTKFIVLKSNSLNCEPNFASIFGTEFLNPPTHPTAGNWQLNIPMEYPAQLGIPTPQEGTFETAFQIQAIEIRVDK